MLYPWFNKPPGLEGQSSGVLLSGWTSAGILIVFLQPGPGGLPGRCCFSGSDMDVFRPFLRVFSFPGHWDTLPGGPIGGPVGGMRSVVR